MAAPYPDTVGPRDEAMSNVQDSPFFNGYGPLWIPFHPHLHEPVPIQDAGLP